MKEIHQEPKLTTIDELNISLKEKSIEDSDLPTVQGIAQSLGIDETTLFSWLHNDIQFATELNQIKRLKEITDEMERKFPELAWTEEEKKLMEDENPDLKTEAFLIITVLSGAKDRHYKSPSS